MSEKIAAVYMIYHKDSLKAYIGKTSNFHARIAAHKSVLTNPVRDPKKCNEYLWSAVQKYGWDAFDVTILERFDDVDEALISERELFWMLNNRTTESKFGYNLRMDSSTKMIVHETTKAKLRISMKGEGNPNFNNKWTEQQRKHMADIAAWRYIVGLSHTESSKAATARASVEVWKCPERKAKMARSVSLAKRLYNFFQYTKEGCLIAIYDSIEEIVEKNPGFKWQNIYAVCGGYKPTYMGYIWKKFKKDDL